MTPLVFLATLVTCVVVTLAVRLAWARRGALYVARVYDERGRTFVIGAPQSSGRLALESAWQRAEGLSAVTHPPFDPKREGYTARVVKL